MHPLGEVKQLTGMLIHIGVFEECSGVKIEPDRITVRIDRVQATNGRAGTFRIKKRGVTLHTYVRNGMGSWDYQPPFTQWWSVDETFGPPVRERDTEWEALGKLNTP